MKNQRLKLKGETITHRGKLLKEKKISLEKGL